MFTVSDDATVAIRRLISRSNVPEGAGMRIAADAGRNSLHIAVATAPQLGDAVYDAGNDTRIFVAEGTGELLEDKTIDALEDGTGRVQFVLGDR